MGRAEPVEHLGIADAASDADLSDDPVRVLVVDDEPWHRALQREILSPPRYALREAQGGEEALRHIDENEFDVVLLDERMPGLSGEEVCRRIRRNSRQPFLPVIMVTGSTSSHDLARCMRAGATDFVRKPYECIELMARLEAAVRHKRMLDHLDRIDSALFALARVVEARDPGTGDHCNRLVDFCASFGRRLELPDADLHALCRGAILHDIGKLAVPDRILLKQGPLNADEWMVMRTHPLVGAHLISGPQSLADVVPIVRFHHERWDGSGYPDGLSGDNIPYLARIFQLADIYDALRSERPYKKAYELPEIIATLKEHVARGWLDPQLTARLLEHLLCWELPASHCLSVPSQGS